jgi:protein MpaA
VRVEQMMLLLLRRAAVVVLAAVVCQPAFAGNGPANGSVASPVDWCEQLVPRLPHVSVDACHRSALVPTGAMSSNGFPILMRGFPSIRTSKPGQEPVRVLLLGGIHGDELTAAAIVFHWMQAMDIPQAQEFHWHVIPILNPDGLLAARPQRMNANGVDLNRNFPTPGWHQNAEDYWARKTRSDPRRYPGRSPLSEPETRWLHAEMERFQPHVIISVHAPYGVLDFDGPSKPPRRFGRLYLSRVGVYPGSLGNYGGMHKNIPVITIELPNAQAMPAPEEVGRIWRDMISWIARNVSHDDGEEPAIQRISTDQAAQDH